MITLLDGPAGLKAARSEALRVCADNDVDPDRSDAVLLVLSELLGNACRHGRGPVCYQADLDGGDVRVCVEDACPSPPIADETIELDAEGGRGLFLVSTVSRSWGWEMIASGKRVWARI